MYERRGQLVETEGHMLSEVKCGGRSGGVVLLA